MKKILLLIPLVMISCKKEDKIAEVINKDSIIITEQPKLHLMADSVEKIMKDSVINNMPVTKKVLNKEMMRNIKDGKIIRTADASHLPFTLGEEFTEDNQELILKISNYDKPVIKANISTKEKDFNIRFNQIKLPNGDYDGPFGRKITYDIKEKGEIWLIIGKNNMASGNTTGNFTVRVE